MAHQRKVIRHAVRDALKGKTAAVGRVFASRVVPLRRTELPAIAVYTLEETVDPESRASAPRELERQMPVVIEGWVTPGDNADDAMDDLAEQIERVMHADPYLGGVVAESILESTSMEVLEDGERLMGLVMLTYAVTYQTQSPEAPSDLDDFVTVDAIYNPGGEVHEDDVAEDMFQVQEVAP